MGLMGPMGPKRETFVTFQLWLMGPAVLRLMGAAIPAVSVPATPAVPATEPVD